MDLPIPTIYGSLSKATGSSVDVCGASSLNVQQLLLTAYAPKISVLSSASADSIAKAFGDLENIQHLFSYFENVFAYGNNYDRPITFSPSSSTTSSLTGSGCVRFVGDVLRNLNDNDAISEELFDLTEFSNDLKKYVGVINNAIENLDAPLNYAAFQKNYKNISSLQNSIYFKLISLLSLSRGLSSFECFNHPVMQLVVISGTDSKDEIANLISNLESSKFPKWLDKSSILQHIIILVDHSNTETLQNALRIQEDIKIRLGKRSTVVPIDLDSSKASKEDPSSVKLLPSLFCQTKSTFERKDPGVLILGKEAFSIWKRPLQEVITKDLLLFMNGKIKQWNDEVVAPRTSLTGRIFGGRKWGGGSKPSFFSFVSNQSATNSGKEDTSTKMSYNSSGGYYLAESPEMILRKLADWYFMLGDYKNAYTIYGLVKKDMINDKAYAHLSSLQEYSVFSLLLGASGKSGASTQPITPKMISTVINPMLDSSFYSYLSRCNLKTYTIRLTIIAAELYFFLGQTTGSTIAENTQSSITPNTETYYNESMILFKKIIDSKLLDNLSNGYLMQRIAYVYLSYGKFHSSTYDTCVNEASYYESENPAKLQVNNPNLKKFGLTRNRKLILWLLLSVKELNPEDQPIQSQLMVWRIDRQLKEDSLSDAEMSWLQRKDQLLAKIKAELEA